MKTEKNIVQQMIHQHSEDFKFFGAVMVAFISVGTILAIVLTQIKHFQ